MENKELQPFAQGELATPVQTTVNQYGEKSVHIDQVGQMSQNVMILPCFQRTASGAMRQTPQTISTEYYHLFVLGGEHLQRITLSFPQIGHWEHTGQRMICVKSSDTYPQMILRF